MSGAPYPWLQDAWQRLYGYRESERVPHALLLTGPEGLGKLELARAFVALLLCNQPSASGACGSCAACVQLQAGSYPDFHEITLEEDDKGKLRRQIVVDQIRELSAKLALTSRQGGWKVALIHPADAMNVNAANSLLKTLEEPAARSLLLLVTHRPAALSATIRSRCQQLAIARPDTAVATAWLQEQGARQPETALAFSGRAPLRAQELMRDGFLEQRREILQRVAAVRMRGASAVTVAAELEKIDLSAVIEFLDAVTEDLVRLLQLPAEHVRLRNPDLHNSLKTLIEGLDLVALHRYREVLKDARRLADTSVNPRLLLESLLLPWAAGMSGPVNGKMLDRLLEG